MFNSCSPREEAKNAYAYTEVNYGKAIADVIRPFIKKNQAAKFYVLDESEDTIQEFSVISKAGTSFVHEDSAPVLPFKAETDILPEKYMIYVNVYSWN